MMRAMGREASIAWGYVVEGLSGFESFWDERRWAMWRDPHQRLGYLVAMLMGLAFWTVAALRSRDFEAQPALWVVLGSLAFFGAWLGVAALSRDRAEG